MFLFFFCIFSLCSNNIFISIEANDTAACSEEFPCSIDKAFSIFQPSDYFILTDKVYDIKKTDQFLTKLESIESNFTIIGNDTVFYSTFYKSFHFNQTNLLIKFSNVIFQTTNITVKSESAIIAFSNVKFIQCDFRGAAFISLNSSSSLSVENVSFLECSGVLLCAIDTIASFVHSNITRHTTNSTIFYTALTSFNIFNSKINKASLQSCFIAEESNIVLKDVRLSNIECNSSIFDTLTTDISLTSSNITKIKSLNHSMPVFAYLSDNSYVLFKKSIVDRIFSQTNTMQFIKLNESFFQSNNFLFQNTKNVILSSFSNEKVDIKYSTFFNNTIDIKSDNSYFITFNNSTSKEFSISNSKFINNSMINSLIYNNKSALFINNSTFIRTKGHIGSALYNNNGNFTISNSQFDNNEAQETGGSIYSVDGSLIVNNTVFNGNVAQTGADISIRNTTFTLLNKITSKESTANKGIFLEAHGKGELQMIDCDFDSYEDNAYDISGIQFDILHGQTEEEEKEINQNETQETILITGQNEKESSTTVIEILNEKMIGDVVYEPPIKDYSATIVIGGIFLFLIVSSFIAIILTRRKRGNSGWYNDYSKRKQGKDV